MKIENIIKDGKITEQCITIPADVTGCVYAAEAILDAMSTCGTENCNHEELVDIALMYLNCASEMLNDSSHCEI